MRKRLIRVVVAALAVATIALGVQVPSAQQPALKRTLLQKQDLSVQGREGVMAHVEIPGGVQSGKHTHPGEEIGYILEGTLVLEREGQAPVTLKAGDSFFVPAGLVHNGKNTGTGTARVVSIYVVEKGKPLATPVQ